MVVLVAHRGASGYAPENTLQAFRKALMLNADIIELDVRATKDKNIVVIHDEEISRVAFGKGFVRDMTLEELLQIPTKSKERILTLDQVINLLKGRCIIKIDIKERGFEKRVVETLQEHNLVSSAIITSALPPTLKRIKHLDSDIIVEYGGLEKYEPIDEILDKAFRVKAHLIAPHYSITTKSLIDTCHEHGFKLHVWTVNDKELAKKLALIGADAITTDYPDMRI